MTNKFKRLIDPKIYSHLRVFFSEKMLNQKYAMFEIEYSQNTKKSNSYDVKYVLKTTYPTRLLKQLIKGKNFASFAKNSKMEIVKTGLEKEFLNTVELISNSKPTESA